MADIIGTTGADTLVGTAGDDVIQGLAGDDTIRGGDGADRIDGGSNNDTIFGEGGDDTVTLYSLSPIAGSDPATRLGNGASTVDGGEGRDTLVLANGTQGTGFNSRPVGYIFRSEGSNGDVVNVSTNGSGGAVAVGTATSFEVVVGSAASDLFFLESRRAAIEIRAGAGDDGIHSGAGADLLYGGDGNDTIDVGRGDTAYGEAGDDQFQISTAAQGVLPTRFDGGEGVDTLALRIQLSSVPQPIDLTMVDGAVSFGTIQGAGIENINLLGYFEINSVLGAITIRGDNNANVITSGFTADQVTGAFVDGGGGADTINVNARNSRFLGGDGDDIITSISASTSSLNNEVRGGAGNDRITSSGQLFGDDGDDFILALQRSVARGGSGNDTMLVVQGDAFGDDGDDWAQIQVGSFDGGVGNDTIELTYPGPLTVDLVQGTVRAADATDPVVRLTSVENVLGGNDDDTITGDGQANRLTGGGGADTLYGGNGDDVLAGEGPESWMSGPDRLFGEAGNDTLSGDAGDDLLDGGSGIDIADYSASNINLTVDLRISGPQDTIGSGMDTLVSIESVTGGLGDDIFSGDGGVNTLRGGRGDDLLSGDGGDDFLYGDAGDDTLVGGAGFDTIDGGDGHDLLLLDRPIGSYFLEQTTTGFRLWNGAEYDTVTNIEGVRMSDGTVYSLTEFQRLSFNPLAYIAGYADLANGYGANALAGYQHYIQNGLAEGRTVRFNPINYLTANYDLAAGYGYDPFAAATHYIEYGRFEGRRLSGFDPFIYGASNPDLARTYGADPNGLTQQFLEFGAREGRPVSGFNALVYAASNPDIATVFGGNVNGLVGHYLTIGADEGRPTDTFDPLIYAAGQLDLARAYGTDARASVLHYIYNGIREGRAAAGFDSTAYLLSNPDLAGLGSRGALLHWLSNGADEGRVGDSLFGREQTGAHSLDAGVAQASLETAGDHDWFETTLVAGQDTTIRLSGVTTGGGTLTDGWLLLYDEAGVLVASSRGAAGSSDAEILFRATTTGRYFLVVAGETDLETGSYRVTVSGGSAANETGHSSAPDLFTQSIHGADDLTLFTDHHRDGDAIVWSLTGADLIIQPTPTDWLV